MSGDDDDVRCEQRYPTKTAALRALQDTGLQFLDIIDEQGPSRELSIARTKVEEAVMWAVKHFTGPR